MLAQLSAWQDYSTHKLYIQQIAIPLTARNNIRILPGNKGIISAALNSNQTSFIPKHTIVGKGIAHIKPLDETLPLKPIKIELKNNRCCIEVHNNSDRTVKFIFRQEIRYFDARSKGLVQINNSRHFALDQYMHENSTPATLSPQPLAFDKPIDPVEMPHISTTTDILTQTSQEKMTNILGLTQMTFEEI